MSMLSVSGIQGDIHTLVGNLQKIDMQKVAKEENKNDVETRFYKKWKVRLSLVSVVAATAAIVGAVALALFTSGVIPISACSKAMFSSGLGIITAAGGLYFPVSNALSHLSDYTKKNQNERELIYADINRIKKLLATKDLNMTPEKLLEIQNVILAAREAFPEDAPRNDALQLLEITQ